MKGRVPSEISIFAAFGSLAQEHDAINLAQGLPRFSPPPFVSEALVCALRDGHHQYAPPSGVPQLRQAIARHHARFYGIEVDPTDMVTVTAGASAGMFSAIIAFVEPGDEVLVFDPKYEAYRAAVQLVGGVLRTIPLYPPDADHATWWFSPGELAAAFGPRTKAFILNTPHNPTGKVFTQDELSLIAELVQRHAVLLLADEVYEHLAYLPARHIGIATLPGIRDRTLTLASASKTFGVTGWRVGWAIGPSELIASVRHAHQTFIYSAPTPQQIAIAACLDADDDYYVTLNADYVTRHDALAATLHRAGMQPLATAGTFFMLLDIRNLGCEDDVTFCKQLTVERGVTPLPCSAFFDSSHPLRTSYVRFTFCSDLTCIEAVGQRLGRRDDPERQDMTR